MPETMTTPTIEETTREQLQETLNAIREYLALSPLERPKSVLMDIVMAHAERALASALERLEAAERYKISPAPTRPDCIDHAGRLTEFGKGYSRGYLDRTAEVHAALAASERGE